MQSADPATAAVEWPASATAFPNNLPEFGVQAQSQQMPAAYLQQQQAPSWQYSGPPSGANFAPSYSASPHSYGSPDYACIMTAETPGGPYQQQTVGLAPSGWPGAMSQPAAAQLPAYISQNAAPAFVGPASQGRQPYMAMSVAAQPSAAYDAAGLYGSPGQYGTAAVAAAAPNWGRQPFSQYAGSAGGAVGAYGPGAASSMHGPAAGSTGSPGNPAWSPAAVTDPGVPGASTGAPTAAAAAVKAKKDAYRAELEQQIRDKAARKAAEKSAIDAEEARKEAELAGYNPWGRAGAGAPLRNAAGQVAVADCP